MNVVVKESIAMYQALMLAAFSESSEKLFSKGSGCFKVEKCTYLKTLCKIESDSPFAFFEERFKYGEVSLNLPIQ